MESSSNGDLPPEILKDIFLRLPVKTLSVCKCVCKQWYTLIASQSFVDQHFDNESLRLLMPLVKPPAEETFALYVDETFSQYEEPEHLQILLGRAADLLGPLNGSVFCVANSYQPYKGIALLNPAIRQFKLLPLIEWNVQPHLIFHFCMLGFGLDWSSGDYKVVRIQYFWNSEMRAPHYPPLVYIYNSGNDSWRHFENVDLVNSMNSAVKSLCSTYLNGVYYWHVGLDNGTVAILAFDMTSEKFQDIQVPDFITSNIQSDCLSVYDDSIALVTYDGMHMIEKCINVWVMRTEGWTKLLTLGPYQDILCPLGFWKHNELLLLGATSVLALDVSTQPQELRTVETPGSSSLFFAYKESLVSIKREGDNCRLWDTTSDFVKEFFGMYE